MNDHYATLGVTAAATEQEIRNAFRQLAKQHHPDVGGDAEHFKKLNEAYTVLSHPEQRAAYDHTRNHVHVRNSPWNEYQYPSNDPFASIFNDFFNGAFAKAQPRNQNLRMTLQVSLASVLEDQTHAVQINTGRSVKTLQVHVPRGVRNGAVINYPGWGQDQIAHAPPGDLFIEIAVRADSKFARQGNDLVSEIAVDCLDALLGTHVEFQSIRGNSLRLRIPAGTQHGYTMRVPNYGLPSFEDNSTGDQYVRVRITVPTNLSPESLDLIRKATEIK